MYVIALKVY